VCVTDHPIALSDVLSITPTIDATVGLTGVQSTINYGSASDLQVQQGYFATILQFDYNNTLATQASQWSQAVVRLTMSYSSGTWSRSLLKCQASTAWTSFTESTITGSLANGFGYEYPPSSLYANEIDYTTLDRGTYTIEFDVSFAVRRRLAAGNRQTTLVLMINAGAMSTYDRAGDPAVVSFMASKENNLYNQPQLVFRYEDGIALAEADMTMRQGVPVTFGDDPFITIQQNQETTTSMIRFFLGSIQYNAIWVRLRLVVGMYHNLDPISLYRINATYLFNEMEISNQLSDYDADFDEDIPAGIVRSPPVATITPPAGTQFGSVLWFDVTQAVTTTFVDEQRVRLTLSLQQPTVAAAQANKRFEFLSKEWLHAAYKPRLVSCFCNGRAPDCSYDVTTGVQCLGCTANTGGNHCQLCVAGYTGSAGLCSPCQQDTYKDTLSSSACTACPINTNSLPGATSSSQCFCATGFVNVTGTCVDIDECALNATICTSPSPCINTPGSYICGAYIVPSTLTVAQRSVYVGDAVMSADQTRVLLNSTKGGQRISVVAYKGTTSNPTLVLGPPSNRGKYACSGIAEIVLGGGFYRLNCTVPPGISDKIQIGVRYCISASICYISIDASETRFVSYPPPTITNNTLDGGSGPTTAYMASNNVGQLVSFRGTNFQSKDSDFKVYLGNKDYPMKYPCTYQTGAYVDDTFVTCRLGQGNTGTDLVFLVNAGGQIAIGNDTFSCNTADDNSRIFC
jgi:hypothetical protein